MDEARERGFLGADEVVAIQATWAEPAAVGLFVRARTFWIFAGTMPADGPVKRSPRLARGSSPSPAPSPGF